jgi:UDP-3-O-[3-hydroxymyristoyl] N-acetylglucosamine deacetylase/3-hydroxyacyl-[acyl-carrier-protein] dehydratase
VLAALAGCGVDNAVVELDANEPPIADGSSREFCKIIQAAGLTPQAEKREFYTPTEPIELRTGETVMTLFPDDRFKITCTSADKKGRFTQFYSTEVNPATWETELAQARTFCFYEEIEYLIKNGLIKGGSLENAIVIRDDAVLTTEPLRYPEEFVRHKMLDIVGDLSLTGRPIRGHLIAVKPSHEANCGFARLIVAQMNKPLRAAQTFAPPPAAAAPETPSPETGAMTIEQIMKMLPHRPPFLLVDRVLKIEGNKIVAVKNVTMNEPFFQGHFPGHPIMPGVLQLEAIAQVAGIVLIKQGETVNQVAYFMSAEDVKWRKPVVPGDVLVIEVELTKVRGKIGKASGVCKVAGEVVSEAQVTFMIREL